MTIQTYRSVFAMPKEPQRGSPACKCTIIPPHMSERIRDVETDLEERIRKEERLASHNDLRVRRAGYFVGTKKLITENERSVVRIYNANNREELPGELAANPEDSGDEDIQEAHYWARKTDEFFREIFQRNSIDDLGMALISTVHYGQEYSNAFWNGAQMAYGDGDDLYFTRFTVDSDITAHEMTHGVTQFDMDLEYQGQSGALNESFSDVIGSMVKQYVQDEAVNNADWLIGERLMIGDQYALRSMKSPGTAYIDHPTFGTDPQPATMDDYVRTSDDNGGVHINSGIPNHAFYLATQKFLETNPVLYFRAWEGAGRVWYEARHKIDSPTTDFETFANATVETAGELFGIESQEQKNIRYAWADVKVLNVGTQLTNKSKCCVLI